MNIFIDIGHPAHVHYIKYFVKQVEKEGHTVLVSARERDFVIYLLNQYNIRYVCRGSGSDTFWGKLFKTFSIDYKIYKIAKAFKPDIFFGPISPYLAHISVLFNKPYIAFSDTECATLVYRLSLPFTSCILTPKSFQKKLGRKQLKFNGYLKTTYLHRNYFNPNPDVLHYLNLNPDEKLIVFRFVAYNAFHDVGFINLTDPQKISLVKKFSGYGRLFISSEGELPDELNPYRIKIPPDMMHDALYYASMFIGQSDTMAAEAALLGTSSIDIQSKGELKEGVIIDLERHGVLSVIDFSPSQVNEIMAIGVEMISSVNKINNLKKLEAVYDQSVDVTALMVWFVINYPESAMILRNNPDIQNRFK